MGKNERDKGSRFERTVARRFTIAFNMNIRRVPLSGGLDIKADLYCPEDDSFRYFVECKNRKVFRVDSLIAGTSDLYGFHMTAEDHANGSYVAQKYTSSQVAIVVFTGGNFREHYVLLHMKDLDWCLPNGDLPPFVACGKYMVIGLDVFLDKCIKKPLTMRHQVTDEDDGYPD